MIDKPIMRVTAWGSFVLGSLFCVSSFSIAKGVEPSGRWIPAVSRPTTTVANWVIASGDNRGLPFLIVDKVAADVAVFDASGKFHGDAPALVGMARGDVIDSGIGDGPLSMINPSQRTTQAGRFFAQFGPSEGMPEVLWIDYRTSLSLHPIITHNVIERRLDRLNSPSPEDNRITFGCINVSDIFYKSVVKKVFTKGEGIVYILPESSKLEDVFPGTRSNLK